MFKVHCKQCPMTWYFETMTDAREQVAWHHTDKRHEDVTVERE